MLINPILLLRFFSEVAGTAMLMCVGCMGFINSNPSSLLQSSLHYGLVTMIVIHCFGSTSGAHANPSITLSCLALGHIKLSTAMVHIVGQVLGAVLGIYLMSVVLPKTEQFCAPIPNDELTSYQIFGIEFILTSILLFGWCAVWEFQNLRYSDGIALRMGLYVTACCLAGGPFTGFSVMNPIRSLAPAVFTGDFENAPMFLGAEFMASLVVPLTWKYLFMAPLTYTQIWKNESQKRTATEKHLNKT